MDSSASATRALPSGVSAISTARFRLSCITFCAEQNGAIRPNTGAITKKIRMISVTLLRCRSAEPGSNESHCSVHQRVPVANVTNAVGDFWIHLAPQHGVGHDSYRKMEPP